jgi:hypothetical protein
MLQKVQHVTIPLATEFNFPLNAINSETVISGGEPEISWFSSWVSKPPLTNTVFKNYANALKGNKSLEEIKEILKPVTVDNVSITFTLQMTEEQKIQTDLLSLAIEANVIDVINLLVNQYKAAITDHHVRIAESSKYEIYSTITSYNGQFRDLRGNTKKCLEDCFKNGEWNDVIEELNNLIPSRKGLLKEILRVNEGYLLTEAIKANRFDIIQLIESKLEHKFEINEYHINLAEKVGYSIYKELLNHLGLFEERKANAKTSLEEYFLNGKWDQVSLELNSSNPAKKGLLQEVLNETEIDVITKAIEASEIELLKLLVDVFEIPVDGAHFDLAEGNDYTIYKYLLESRGLIDLCRTKLDERLNYYIKEAINNNWDEVIKGLNSLSIGHKGLANEIISSIYEPFKKDRDLLSLAIIDGRADVIASLLSFNKLKVTQVHIELAKNHLSRSDILKSIAEKGNYSKELDTEAREILNRLDEFTRKESWTTVDYVLRSLPSAMSDLLNELIHTDAVLRKNTDSLIRTLISHNQLNLLTVFFNNFTSISITTEYLLLSKEKPKLFDALYQQKDPEDFKKYKAVLTTLSTLTEPKPEDQLWTNLIENSEGISDCAKELLTSELKKNHLGQKVMDVVIAKNKPEIIKTLIELGVDINERNKKGNTALQRAFHQSKWEIVEILGLANLDHAKELLNNPQLTGASTFAKFTETTAYISLKDALDKKAAEEAKAMAKQEVKASFLAKLDSRKLKPAANGWRSTLEEERKQQARTETTDLSRSCFGL